MLFRKTLGLAAVAGLWAQAALAQDAIAEQAGGNDLARVGVPVDRLTGFQPPSTPVAIDVQWLDGMLHWISAAIVVFVVLLLVAVVVRFNQKRNPTPATFTHNSPLEVAWTIVPIVILVFIGAFSLPVLFNQQEIPDGDIYIKATGEQWYWNYEYVDEAVAFDSYMIGQGANIVTPDVSAELAAYGYTDDEFRLATDTAVVVPVGAVVVMTVTASEVLHAWTIPAFGVKQDAVPGRLAQLWFRADTVGVYFGQCSELCGNLHAYMPITVRVVSQEDYDAWLAVAKVEDAV